MPPGFGLPQKALFRELIQVLRCGQPGNVQVILKVFNLGVGMPEQVVQQVLAVNFRQLRPDAVFAVQYQGFYGVDRPDGLPGRAFHAVQHVHYPAFPVIHIPHPLQQAVIFALASDNVATKIQHRDMQQLFGDQVQNADDSTGPAIAVIKRVDGFKLMMNDRHFH
jgi:hypothetical protein